MMKIIKNLIFVCFGLGLVVSCSNEKEPSNTVERINDTFEEKSESNAESLDAGLLSFEDWESFFFSLIGSQDEEVYLSKIHNRDSLSDPIDEAALETGFTKKGSLSILDEKGFNTIGNLSYYFYERKVIFLYKTSNGRVDLFPIWNTKDYSFFSRDVSSFGFLKQNLMIWIIMLRKETFGVFLIGILH